MNNSTSQNLRRKSQLIMTRWEERARKELASGYGTTSLSMRDSLPKHLDQLAEALDSAGEKSTREIAITTLHEADIGKEHGRDRANSEGYSIDEVIFEYRILRQVITQVLEEDAPLSNIEREIITDLIEQAVNDAASEFSEAVRDLRNQFTATLTHDLRGPITAAKASAELIIRYSSQPELCVKYATRIVDCVNRMDSMVQNLLDAGRIRAGQSLQVLVDECNPTAIAREIIDEMTVAHGARFLLSSDSNLRAWWSVDLFRRALENLVGNAVKYGDPNQSIQVRIEPSEAMVKVAVHNDGNPIPPGELPTLFERYRRSQSAAAGSQKGWGLGLTLVLGVVQALAGTIEVKSTHSDGTTFTMMLPLDCRSKNLTAA